MVGGAARADGASGEATAAPPRQDGPRIRVPLLDLTAQYAAVEDDVRRAIDPILQSQQFVLGEAVRECERAVAHYCGCAHGIGVSSGTDALLVALMAEGVGPGDEVVTTPFSFFATAGVVARLGATPVFADVDPVTLNLDPAEVERRVTKRTKALMPVHLFGRMADMDPIMEIARRRRLVVIEDAAQAAGAEYKGRRAGSIGHYGCLSFFPTKNLGAFGEGGMVVTNDANRARKVAALRVHGQTGEYVHAWVGGNFRLDALQAAVVRAKLPWLDGWSERRRANARAYARLFAASALGDDPRVELPGADDPPGGRQVFNQYVVRLPHRDAVKNRLARAGIGTAVYYPLPLHLQPCFSELGGRAGDCPASERAAARALALPVYPELAGEMIEAVAKAVEQAVAEEDGKAAAADRAGGEAGRAAGADAA